MKSGEIIYKAQTQDGYFRIVVVAYNEGWRIYSQVNNGRIVSEPFAKTHSTLAQVIRLAKETANIFHAHGIMTLIDKAKVNSTRQSEYA